MLTLSWQPHNWLFHDGFSQRMVKKRDTVRSSRLLSLFNQSNNGFVPSSSSLLDVRKTPRCLINRVLSRNLPKRPRKARLTRLRNKTRLIAKCIVCQNLKRPPNCLRCPVPAIQKLLEFIETTSYYNKNSAYLKLFCRTLGLISIEGL